MQEDAAPRNMNAPFRRVVGSACGVQLYMVPGSRHCPASVQLLAVQNKLQIDMHAFLADVIRGFSCIVSHRLIGG